VKIKILPSALADLDRGRIFYARQSKGIGDYFLDSLFSDIDSLELYAGVRVGYEHTAAAGKNIQRLGNPLALGGP